MGSAMLNNPANRIQKEIAERLMDIPEFKEYRVEVIEQNSVALAHLLQKTMGQVKGCLVVVAVDSFTNNPPVLEADVSVTCFENVAMNRQARNYLTAVDVAMLVVEGLDGEEWGFQEMTQDNPEAGVLTSAVKFKGQAFRYADASTEVEVEPRQIEV